MERHSAQLTADCGKIFNNLLLNSSAVTRSFCARRLDDPKHLQRIDGGEFGPPMRGRGALDGVSFLEFSATPGRFNPVVTDLKETHPTDGLAWKMLVWLAPRKRSLKCGQ